MDSEESEINQSNSSTPLPENFGFILNIGQIPEDQGFLLAPSHRLRRATPDERAVIKQTLERHYSDPFGWHDFFWEHKWPPSPGPIEILPEPEWRYFVVAFSGGNQTLNKLEYAFQLSTKELEIGFIIFHARVSGQTGRVGTVFPSGGGISVPVLNEAWAFDNNTFFESLSVLDLAEIVDIFDRMQQHDNSLVDVNSFARQLLDLKGLPHRSPLRFLGYFAILESLLTHTPNPTDPYDSITRQIKKKIALLDHRWQPPIDYSAFNGQPKKIWTAMYAYRSLLAHGGRVNFKDGKICMLVNHESALRLLKDTVKAVVRYALIEPRLLVDLKDC